MNPDEVNVASGDGAEVARIAAAVLNNACSYLRKECELSSEQSVRALTHRRRNDILALSVHSICLQEISISLVPRNHHQHEDRRKVDDRCQHEAACGRPRPPKHEVRPTVEESQSEEQRRKAVSNAWTA